MNAPKPALMRDVCGAEAGNEDRMQPSDITPFIRATRNVFDTMLRMPVTFGDPRVITSHEPQAHHVSGIIGLSGDLVGAVAVMFPKQTADLVVRALAGPSADNDSELFADAIGEIANMISGAAKAQYEGKTISISCPSVVIGSGHQIHQQSNTRSVAIPCRAGGSPFDILVSLRKAESAMKSAAA